MGQHANRTIKKMKRIKRELARCDQVEDIDIENSMDLGFPLIPETLEGGAPEGFVFGAGFLYCDMF